MVDKNLKIAEVPSVMVLNPSGAIAVVVVVGGTNEITSECPLN